MAFVPLHIVSGYSILQSGLTVSAIVNHLKASNISGCGLTDNETLGGLPPLAYALEKIDKKVVPGISFIINNDHISLFALNEEGYHTLIKVSSIYRRGEDIIPILRANPNTIAVIETVRGNLFEIISNAENNQEIADYLRKYINLFKELYLGIEITSKDEIEYAKKVRSFADNFSYTTIAFPRIRYLKKEDAIVIDMVEAIRNNEKIEIKEKEGMEYFLEDKYYPKLYTEQEIKLTEKILNDCDFKFKNKRGKILKYPVENSKEYLYKLALDKLNEKDLNKSPYIERLNHELDVICSMHFEDYFLIVYDYTNYARTHDILVGPGRGSAAGSLVSYVLGITDLDPIKYNLSFERFLNKSRITMPDIDIDFMDTKRNDMVQYMRDRFGEDKVAVISTYTTIKSKQSIRDVGRIFSFPETHVNLLCKTLVDDKASLRQSYKTIPAFKALVDDGDYFLNIIKLAAKIEGLPRQMSIHAAGIILNDQDVNDSIPTISDGDGHYYTQYEAPYLEDQGFLKMDFLSLSNLTTIYECVNLINSKYKEQLDAHHLPFDIPETYEIISQRDTAGIFQIESAGMNRAIKKLKPRCFEEVAVVIALFRPGPMNELDTYVKRRNGAPFKYLNPSLEPILSSTYGVIVYQEQISQVAEKVALFTPEEADILRYAICKKKKAMFDELSDKFIAGAIKNGYSEADAKQIFSLISKFEDYGFNKSHTFAYAMIVCEMAFLKAKYPLEFYSTLLDLHTSVNDNKFGNYLRELNRIGYKILAPNVNESTDHFEITDKGLLFPLNRIKEINDDLTSRILGERENNGPYKDMYDFTTRLYPKISAENLRKLIDSGSFDIFGKNRATHTHMILAALQRAQALQTKDGQIPLATDLLPLPRIKDYEDDPMEKLTREYDAIWMTLSSNPLEVKRDELNSKNITTISDIDEANAHFAGIIRDIKIIKTKKDKKQMAFVTVYDETGECELVIFSDLFNSVATLLTKNACVEVTGYLRRNDKYDEEEENNSYIIKTMTLLNTNE